MTFEPFVTDAAKSTAAISSARLTLTGGGAVDRWTLADADLIEPRCGVNVCVAIHHDEVDHILAEGEHKLLRRSLIAEALAILRREDALVEDIEGRVKGDRVDGHGVDVRRVRREGIDVLGARDPCIDLLTAAPTGHIQLRRAGLGVLRRIIRDAGDEEGAIAGPPLAHDHADAAG